MSNLDQPGPEWLAEQFYWEYCAECGGDDIHHTAVPFMDNWFARCDYPMIEHDHRDWEPHPVIAAYKEQQS